jgi:hypothetical protein
VWVLCAVRGVARVSSATLGRDLADTTAGFTPKADLPGLLSQGSSVGVLARGDPSTDDILGMQARTHAARSAPSHRARFAHVGTRTPAFSAPPPTDATCPQALTRPVPRPAVTPLALPDRRVPVRVMADILCLIRVPRDRRRS